MSILDQGPLSRIRRNHGLEHATMQILSKRNPAYRMAGHSDAGGFWLLGDVPSEEVQSAVEEALLRLSGGEHSLAVHPNCGTNFVAAGVLAGSAAWLGMLGTDGSWKKKLERWPFVISLVTIALVLAQPLGPLLQARVTTSGDPQGLRVTGILRKEQGGLPAHRVVTQD